MLLQNEGDRVCQQTTRNSRRRPKKTQSLQSHSSVTQSCLILRPYGLQHASPPCPSPTPRACPNSCLSSRWCHSTISFSVAPFSCLQSFPASGSFPMSQFFASVGQNICIQVAEAEASASVLPMNIQDWFPLGWTSWISLQSKGLSRVFSNTTVHISESQPDQNVDLSLPASRSMGQQLSVVFSQKVAVSYTEVLENEDTWLTDTSLQFIPLSSLHLLLCVYCLLISLSLFFFFLIWSLFFFF